MILCHYRRRHTRIHSDTQSHNFHIFSWVALLFYYTITLITLSNCPVSLLDLWDPCRYHFRHVQNKYSMRISSYYKHLECGRWKRVLRTIESIQSGLSVCLDWSYCKFCLLIRTQLAQLNPPSPPITAEAYRAYSRPIEGETRHVVPYHLTNRKYILCTQLSFFSPQRFYVLCG
jgi:hypothetical protein